MSLHERLGSPRLYYKVGRTHSFSKEGTQPLFIYYRLFRLYILELDPRLCLHIKFKFIQKIALELDLLDLGL